MRAAESRKKVIERNFVAQVNDCKLRTPFISVAMEQVVMPYRDIEQVTRINTGRILIVVFRTGSRYLYKCRSELRCRTRRGQGRERSRMRAIAGKPSLELLICGEPTQVDRRAGIGGKRD